MIEKLRQKSAHVNTNYTTLRVIGAAVMVVTGIWLYFFYPSQDKEKEPSKTPAGQIEKNEKTGIKTSNRGTARFSVKL